MIKQGMYIIQFELLRLRGLFLVWVSVWVGMSILLFAFYDSIIANKDGINALLESFPKELLEAFGSSVDDFLKISGYFNSQFISLYFIAAGILGAYLGVKIIGGEVHSKSLLFVLNKPVSRFLLIIAKIKAVAIFLTLTSIAIIFPTMISAELMTSYSPLPLNYFVLCGVIMFFYSLFFVALGLLAGLFLEQSAALALIIVYSIASFFLNSMSGIEGFPEWISFLTVYKLIDLEEIASTESWNISHALILIVIIAILTLVSVMKFRGRDINV